MFKDTLDQEILNYISSLFKKETEECGTYTEIVMDKISCSRSFVSKLRKNWRDNEGQIFLKKPGYKLVKELQNEALHKHERYFATAKDCTKCETDLRYASTGSCVTCSKIRNQRHSGSLNIVAGFFLNECNLESTPLPLFDKETRLESGLLCI